MSGIKRPAKSQENLKTVECALLIMNEVLGKVVWASVAYTLRPVYSKPTLVLKHFPCDLKHMSHRKLNETYLDHNPVACDIAELL
ncbi:hypothetical protein L596_026788 [Steinernema carpocapsae]|uniref:Uncharacterized protein n=1 Tax=Steinernema carpocapsae TaxID=34508 RepID=A0A4U5M2E7_STECR|nr:hypothetical protein L596_026788 [Steinernema carpocapsae]